ncbi:unnamed protein product [Lactuca saligna]|uniref:Uncharacterized protein n=1 Tax=Lactuca saligna TaxID=75948 RepID=A0AA35VCF6_LACSI|nr:unnamed protein product [Lactuca saligna]
MAEALVTIAAEGILKKVLTIAASEIATAWNYEEKLNSLHKKLELIRARLRDAEKRKETEAVRAWLKQLKEAVVKADDVLDEVDYEILRRQIRKQDQVARKPAGTVPDPDRETVPDLDRETVPYPEKFQIFGRDDEKQRIVELLTESRKEEELTILPIVGMGGIGKTALAKLVYNDEKIEQYFDVRKWLCVSVKVSIVKLLEMIYESVAGKEPELHTKVYFIDSLKELLASKRYLLVLDDVWVEERQYWEDFRKEMQYVNSQNGSGILITTRKLAIGTHDMIRDSCNLEGLSNDECWSIFRGRAFVPGKSPPPELEAIGREIVKKCCGLPLLLNVIGGMLANDTDPEKWLSIKTNNVWDIEEGNKVQRILELSFDNLPNSIVKQCFVYCSIFKKDEVMEREELVRLWIALGLVHEEKNKEMEDVGNDVFQILVSNSLFQDVRRDEYGHITHCSMHDLVHDLSLSLSNHESRCLVDATNDDIASIPHVKHLSFHQELIEDDEFGSKVSMFIERKTVATTLHTLFIKVVIEKKFPFQKLKCIRVLKLQVYIREKLDDSIGGLVHLRYLDLTYTNIRVLPKSIGKLYHLQTLKLPENIEQFPETMRNLICLRYLISDTNIPANILGELIYLRKLSSVKVVGRKGHGIEKLRNLNNLTGTLCIFNLENVESKEDAVNANLSRKKNLYNIEFSWSGNNDEDATRNNKDVLEGLQPPRDVKKLTFSNFSGDNFAEWVTKMAIHIKGKWTPLDKLIKITLSGCRSCLSLPTLEHLPHLRDLVLKDMDSLTSLRNTSDVTGSTKPLSPSLRSLTLQNMERLEKWIDGATNSSKMISPVLDRECPSLLGIPNLPNQCHSLKTLFIAHCEKLTSFPQEMFDCFAFLNDLKLGPFSKELDSFPSLQGIEKLRNHLHSLTLYGDDHWESMPEEIQHLTSLTSLTISGFRMRELPKWLKNMSSIRKLYFYGCEGLNKEIFRQGAPREATYVKLNYQRALKALARIELRSNSSLLVALRKSDIHVDDIRNKTIQVAGEKKSNIKRMKKDCVWGAAIGIKKQIQNQ